MKKTILLLLTLQTQLMASDLVNVDSQNYTETEKALEELSGQTDYQDVYLYKDLNGAIITGETSFFEYVKKTFQLQYPKERNLFNAIGANDIKQFSELLSQVDVNIKDWTGTTLLMQASIFGKVEIVKVLLENSNIEINEQDSLGQTALMHAAFSPFANEHFRHEVIKLLLFAGTDPSIKNVYGDSFLTSAEKFSDINIAYQKYLQEKEKRDAEIISS